MNKRPPLHRRQLFIDKNIQGPLLLYFATMTILGVLCFASISLSLVFLVQWGVDSFLARLGLFFAIALVFGVLTFFGVYLTNKVAGPLYRLKNHMKSISEGGEIKPLTTRKGDFTDELIAEYNRLLEKFKP